jgi:hypothetical protein
VTYAAARVVGIAFDILRVLDGVSSAEMYSDVLGRLINRLRGLQARRPMLPGLASFIGQLEGARDTRNDVLHALPVKDGLHRRTSHDLGRVRNFFTVDDLRAAADQLEAAHVAGSRILYHDGGAAVHAWCAAGGS